METYATTLKYNTAEAALEKNQPKFSQGRTPTRRRR